MASRTSKWDSAKYLNTKEDIADYLEAVLEEEDSALLIHAIGQVARAQGMQKIAAETNVNRENLYRSLAKDGNPSFSTVMAVLKSIGMQIHIEPAQADEAV